MVEQHDLIIAALQQRIGEIVSSYETQIAVLRSELTMYINEKTDKENALKQYEEQISGQGE
jgi:hypothetical protein